jgi:hypothetical protein
MFARIIDDFKDATGIAMRQSFLVAAAALAMFITTSFLCAAAFVAVLQRYGLIEACLTGAAVFFVVTLIAAISYMMRKRQLKVRIKEAARDTTKSAMQSALADPMLVAAGVQIIRAIGIKKLIPILAIGGVALGFLASRNAAAASDEAPAE